MELDLHVHTYFSYDCFQSPRKVLTTAERRGLDAVAITDHNSFQGAREAESLSAGYDVMCIPGMEIRTKDFDDVLALFLEEEITARSFTEVVAEVRKQDAVVILPHPYRKLKDIPKSVLDSVDAIEGINARSRKQTNKKARELGREYELPLTGSSDAHTSPEIGRARTRIVDRQPQTVAELKDALLKGDFEFHGAESAYYFYYGLSVLIERVKDRTGFRAQNE